jgi:hypothetical protein
MEYISEGVDIHEIAKEVAKQCDSAISILDPSSKLSFLLFWYQI